MSVRQQSEVLVCPVNELRAHPNTRVRYYTALLHYPPTMLLVKEGVGVSGQAPFTQPVHHRTHTRTHARTRLQEPFKRSSRPKEPVSGLREETSLQSKVDLHGGH